MFGAIFPGVFGQECLALSPLYVGCRVDGLETVVTLGPKRPQLRLVSLHPGRARTVSWAKKPAWARLRRRAPEFPAAITIAGGVLMTHTGFDIAKAGLQASDSRGVRKGRKGAL